jgi:hypothetical protein
LTCIRWRQIGGYRMPCQRGTASGTGRELGLWPPVRLVGQGPGEPEARQDAGAGEEGDGGDPVAVEGEHD